MQLITRQADLIKLCNQLRTYQFITVDTEFIRDKTFWPQLCLIQVGCEDLIAIIDPLALENELAPFFQLMADPNVIKVFHSARQDIEIFYQYGNVIPDPLFDTQVAAKVLGYGNEVSYVKLARMITNAKIDKGPRVSNWRMRPLSGGQLAYAAADVSYLRQIYTTLKDMLTAKDRQKWIDDEIKNLTDPALYDLKDDKAWQRITGITLTSPTKFTALKRIAAWREHKAKSLDVPRKRIISDRAIVDLVRIMPVKAEMLVNSRIFPAGFANSATAKDIMAIIREINSLDKDQLEKLPSDSKNHGDKQTRETDETLCDAISLLLKILCRDNKLAPNIVASAREIKQLAAHGEDSSIRALQGWRYQLFGRHALKIIAGELTISVKDGQAQINEQHKIEHD